MGLLVQKLLGWATEEGTFFIASAAGTQGSTHDEPGQAGQDVQCRCRNHNQSVGPSHPSAFSASLLDAVPLPACTSACLHLTHLTAMPTRFAPCASLLTCMCRDAASFLLPLQIDCG